MGSADAFGRSIDDSEAIPIIVLQRIEHDEGAFTQGLLIHNHKMYESTGLYNHSSLRELDLTDGSILRSIDLPEDEFGEGLALVDQTLYVLTWKAGIVHRYNVSTFSELSSMTYQGEGWGLCWNGEHLAMSNGSSSIAFRNPDTFAIERIIEVTLNGSPVANLNELECVGNHILANVWFEEIILDIDDRTGEASMALDASGLLTSEEAQDANVLNGIAWDHENADLWITGKLWPAMFRVGWDGSEHWPNNESTASEQQFRDDNESVPKNSTGDSTVGNQIASNNTSTPSYQSNQTTEIAANPSDCPDIIDTCDAECGGQSIPIPEGCPTHRCDCDERAAVERSTPLGSGAIAAISVAAILNRTGIPKPRAQGKADKYG